MPQRGDRLADRLAHAFDAIGGPTFLVGMDTPQLDASTVSAAIELLARPDTDAVIGPALDGGWWSIGLRRPDRRAFHGVEMSTSGTYAQQLARLAELELRTRVLSPLRDVDDFGDALAVAELAPATRFARAVRALEYPVGSRAARMTRAPGTTSHTRRPHVAGTRRPLVRRRDRRRRPAPRGAPTVPCSTSAVGRPGTCSRSRLAGIVTLGIDISGPALAVARQRGAPVLHRSIFGRIPGRGRWGTALLLDGNIGIGGDPELLLRRVAGLLRVGGRTLVELEPPGRGRNRDLVRLEHDGEAGPWFAWAEVGVDELEDLARGAGLRVHDIWSDGNRHFARLDP